jgi:hypothetical protein
MLNWSESYRGGGLAALGGALVFGGVLRLMHASRVRDGAIAGAGLVLLAVSRPFEGVVLAAGCAIGLIALRRVRVRPLLVASAVVAAGLLAVGAHNRAVTGSFTVLPWVEYARQYDPAPQFVWQRDKALPQYRNAEFRFVYERIYRRQYERLEAPGGLLAASLQKVSFLAAMLGNDPENRRPTYLLPLFFVPLIFLPRALRDDPHARVAALVILLFLFAPLSMWVSLLTHYVAPVAAAVATLMLILLRTLARSARGWTIAAAIAIAFAINAVSTLRWWTTRADGTEPARQRLVAAAGAGKHLFIVDPAVHGVVYNGPDIDAANVVWARDLGDNTNLRAYFRERKQWRVVRGEGKLLLEWLP